MRTNPFEEREDDAILLGTPHFKTYIQGQDMELQALQAACMIRMALKAFGGPYNPHNEAYDVWEMAWARLEEEATRKGAKCAKWPNVQIGTFMQIGYMCKLGQGRELTICAKKAMLARRPCMQG